MQMWISAREGLFYSRTAELNYFVGNAPQTNFNDRQPWIIPNSVVDIREDPNHAPDLFGKHHLPLRVLIII